MFVIVLVEVYLVVFSLWTFIRYERYDFSRTAIRKFCYREFMKGCVNVGVMIVTFSIIAVIGDRIAIWYVHSVVPTLLSPETEQVLTTQPLTPAGYRETIPRYLEVRAYALSYSSEAIALSIGVLTTILFTPLLVAVLYFWQIRSLLSLVGSYLGFAIFNIGLERVLSGGLITSEPAQLGKIGLLSILPAIVANLWVEITAVFKDLWNRIDCPHCDEMIKADSSVCRFCGTPLTECSACGEITQSDATVCLYCDATLRKD